MCGMFGFVTSRKSGTLKGALADYVQQATLVGSLRGMDSVGYAAREQSSNRDAILKLPISGPQMFAHPMMLSVKEAARSASIFIGHNRAATKGQVNFDNCHPFKHAKKDGTGDIIGVHNGTLLDFHWGAKTEKRDEFNVDSDWLYYQLAQYGDEAFKKFDGSYALAYIESGKNQLSLVRGKDRSLAFAYVEGHPALLFASELKMLLWLADRLEIPIEGTGFEMREGYRISFDIEDPRKQEVTELPKYERPSYSHSSASGHQGHFFPGASGGSSSGSGGTNVGTHVARQTRLAQDLLYEDVDPRDKERVNDREAENAVRLVMMGDFVTARITGGDTVHARAVLSCRGVPEKESVSYPCLLRRPSAVTASKLAKSAWFVAPIIGVQMSEDYTPRDLDEDIVLILGEPHHYILRDGMSNKEKSLFDEESTKIIAGNGRAGVH